MRRHACAWALLGIALATRPALAFSNEYRTGPLYQSAGHGMLVRMAASGTVFDGRSLELIQAQRELDFPETAPGSLDLGLAEWWRALLTSCTASEQKKHFLRWYSGLPAWRASTHPLEDDWAEAVGYVQLELFEAYHASVAGEALPLGHALHTLQDSFSPAHVERLADGRIHTMAYFPAQGGHQLNDARDRIRTDSGELTAEAQQAVIASRELLVGFARWRGADDSAFGRWVEAFTARHLGLDAKQTPRP